MSITTWIKDIRDKKGEAAGEAVKQELSTVTVRAYVLDHVRLILAQNASLRLHTYTEELRASIVKSRQDLVELECPVPPDVVDLARRFVRSDYRYKLMLHATSRFVEGHGLLDCVVAWIEEEVSGNTETTS